MEHSEAVQPPQLPKISVVVAVYNNCIYLADALKSALAQDYPNMDVWVVDDCSTEDILAWNFPGEYTNVQLAARSDEVEFARLYNFVGRSVFYVKLKSNGGPSRARNIAIVNALQNGTHLIQVLDSDDQMYVNKITKLIEPILKDPERVALAYADYHIINEQGLIRYEVKPPYDYQQLMGGLCMIHSGCLINGLMLKHFLPTPYPEDLRVTEDFFLWRTILRNIGWFAVHIAEPLTLVRSHSNDSTNSVSKEIWNRDFQQTMQRS